VSFTPLSALERCDLCHDLHGLRKVHFNGRQFLCRKCREDGEADKECKLKVEIPCTSRPVMYERER
jgi:hypothetical protein